MYNFKLLASLPIHRKILLLLLFIYLPACGIILVAGLQERSEKIEAAGKNALLMVQSLAAQQEQLIVGTKQMLSTLAQLPDVQKLDSAACTEIFRALCQRYPSYSVIAASTRDGNVFAASKPLGPGVINLSDRKHIKDAIRTLDFSAGEYVVGRVSKVPSLNFSFPVLDAKREPVAILIAGFKLDEYARFLAKVPLPEGSSVTIADDRGIRLLRLPQADAIPSGRPLGRDLFERVSGQSEQGVFEKTGEDGIDRIYAFKQLRLKEGMAPYLYIQVGIPRELAVRRANIEMLGRLSVLGIIAAIAMVLGWFSGDFLLSRPIGRLVSAARRLGEGDMGVRTQLPHTADELGQIAKSFDDMASLLEKRDIERNNAQEELNLAYAQLEEKVQERTIDLARSNALLKEEIAERRRAEAAIQDARERYQNMFRFMKNGVAVYRSIDDGEDFIIEDFNPVAERISRVDRATLVGKRASECFPRFKELGVLSAMQRVFRTGEPESISHYYRDDVREGWREGFMYRLPTGEVVTIYDDVTDRIRAEEERKRLESQLRQAQKLKAIGTLAGGIAHDFNNILGPIIGYTELALLDIARRPPRRQDLQEVLKAAHRAKYLVKQILAFSHHGQEQERTITNIDSIVKEALDLLRASLPATIEVRQNIERGWALADATQIHQVLINLCTNAAQAMDERGVLEVGLACVDLGQSDLAALSIPDILPGSYLRLRVSDTGCGMSADIMERVFDPYFTTKEVGKGSGLGLSIVHGIIKRHEGAVTVHSRPGNGSTFEIYIPALEERMLSPAASVPDLPGGNERILVVDDEEAMADLGARILRQLGYQATAVTNSRQAWDLFCSKPDDFDLVMTDYTMPDLTGADLSAKIHDIRPHMPVILLTGFSEKVTEETAGELGISAFAMKPLEMSQLAELVRCVLDGKKA